MHFNAANFPSQCFFSYDPQILICCILLLIDDIYLVPLKLPLWPVSYFKFSNVWGFFCYLYFFVIQSSLIPLWSEKLYTMYDFNSFKICWVCTMSQDLDYLDMSCMSSWKQHVFFWNWMESYKNVSFFGLYCWILILADFV